MRSRTKALGLALAATVAIGAATASIASAEGPGLLTSAFDEPVTLTGEDDGENSLIVLEDTTKCPGSSYTGHKVLTHEETTAEKTHKFLENKDTQFTITPHYKQTDGETANCDVNGGEFSATITMNGCDYRFYDFTTKEKAGEYSFKTDFVCPPGQQIVLHVYAGHNHSFNVCEATIQGGQKELTGGTATNKIEEGDHFVTLTGTIGGITASKTGLCGEKEEENAEYKLNVKLEAHSEAEEPADITLSDTR